MNSMLSRALYLMLSAVLCSPSLVWAGGGHEHGHGHSHGHGHEEEHSPPKGPHGGRMLCRDDFSLEVTIFEEGVPPRYRLFAFQKGDALPSTAFEADVELTRFGNERERLTFVRGEGYLESKEIVEEPHSFVVEITVRHGGKEHSWEYESFEGRTVLSDEALRVANLGIETAGPGTISSSARVYGRLLANEDRLAHIGARFPGIIREIRKSLGDHVEKGDVLAVVESNQNLQPYEVRSLIAGTVLQRHATLGEVVSDDEPIYVVADLSSVWADFQVYRDTAVPITVGQKVKVELGEQRAVLEAVVSYVSPVVDEVTQSTLVRAVLPNPTGDLRPGLFVAGLMTSAEMPMPLVVKREAVQTFRDWNVVYLTDGHTFQAVPVELGKHDEEYIEVIRGLEEGDRYVARNSFVVKADVEKSGASHDH